MTVAIVALALALGTSIALNVIYARRQSAFPETLIAHGKAQVQAENERDGALARATKAEAENVDLRAQLAASQKKTNEALAKGVTCAVEVVRSAPDAAVALRELNELLATMPGADHPGDATAGDRH